VGNKNVFRGNAPAQIDDKGRLKVPNVFRSLLEGKYGREVFITSLTGEYVRIYPMPVWMDIEEKLGRMPSSHPARDRYLDRVNYYGQVGELDAQGRVILPVRLRASAAMSGEVDVIGHYNYLDVWNHEKFQIRLKTQEYTDQDAHAMAEYGI
jgi:MraZ protein